MRSVPDAQAGSRASTAEQVQRSRSGRRRDDIKLLALDMDGTLLDSSSHVLPSSVEALKAAAARGVMLCLATGKARPGAVRAMQAAGLAGIAWLAAARLHRQGRR